MAISVIGTPASAATTTVTVPAHAIGDYIVIVAMRSATTAPTLPAGYTSIVTGSGNSNSYTVGYKVATATNDTSGTWTNASLLLCTVYRGVSKIGASVAATKVASTTATIGALTLQNANSKSWVVAFAGHAATSTQGTPLAGATTSRVTQTSGTYNAGMFDTNAGVNTFSATTSSNTTSVVSSGGAIELISADAMSTFIDPMTASTQDTTKWTGNFGTLSWSPSGFTISQTAAYTGYGGETSKQYYDLTGSAFYCVMPTAANQALTSSETSPFQLLLNTTNYLGVYINGGNIQAHYQVGGVDTFLGSISYNSATMSWFKISELSGTITWAYSADGTTWTTLATNANPIVVTALQVQPVMGTFNSEASGTSAVWTSFNTAPSSIVTKTQTSIARIANNKTKTQPATARIATTPTKTQGAIARIARSVTKTQSAIARVANTTTKTQPAISRIANAKTKTQPAVARVANLVTKTQSATANIITAGTVTKTQTATARIATTVTKTQSAVARIANLKTKTQTAVSRIANNFTKTQAAVARVAKTVTKTQPATAHITAVVTKTQSAISRISNSKTKTQPAIARVANKRTKTQSATANITTNAFSWKGYSWLPRTDAGAPQYNGNWSISNVIGPDINGYMTLRISNPTGSSPIAAEFDSVTKGWGYGTYTVVVGTRLDNLNNAVVAGGLFLYDSDTHTGDTAISHNEIDVNETSKWGGTVASTDHNLFYNNAGATASVTDGYSTTSDVVTTHRMIWTANRVTYESFIGTGTSGTLLKSTVYRTNIPVPALEQVVFNAWVTNATGTTPSTVPQTDIVIRDFTFTPFAAVAIQTATASVKTGTARLTDDFSAATIDTTKWTSFNNGSNTISQASGKLVISTSTVNAYSGYTSVNFYSLTSSYSTVQLVNAGNQALTSLEVVPNKMYKDVNNSIWWYLNQGTLAAYKTVGGTSTSLATATYNSTNHQYLSIAEGPGRRTGVGTTGTIYYETSADGVTWTLFTSLANPFAITDVGFEPSVGTFSNEASGTSVTLDNINVIPQTNSKTQSAIARIANTRTKTQTAVARIAVVKTKTQPAIARIARAVTKTQTATANITQTGVFSKTQTAIARIQKTVTKTQSAVARIAQPRTLIQSAVAHVSITGTATQSAKAKIIQNANFTPFTLTVSGGGRTSTTISGSKVAEIAGGATLDSVSSGTKNETIQTGDKDTTVTGSGTAVNL